MSLATQDGTVTIVTSADKTYLPFFGVMVSSLFAHRNPARKYHLYMLTLDANQREFNDIADLYQNDNFELTLLDAGDHFNRHRNISLKGGFPIETLLRLAVMDLLPDVHKILYLDGDLVVLDDVSTLFDMDIEDVCLAAAKDIGIAGMAGGFDRQEGNRLEKLGIPDTNSYFSAGVLLWNLDESRKMSTSDQLISWTVNLNPRYADQDCLNYFYQGKVKFFDMKWNTLFDSENIRVSEIAPHAPDQMQREYESARRLPSIFHYAGPVKPWSDDVDGSSLFWREARRSALYEHVLINYLSKKDVWNSKLVWKTLDDVYFRLSEAERIRKDLHKRLSAAESRIDELRSSENRLIQEVDALRHEVEEYRNDRIPLTNKLYRKIRDASSSKHQ